MITLMRTILCYGDSNTWAYVPYPIKNVVPERYPRSIRWTGRLQNLLGDEYHVVEEGLNGRTTNVDYPIPPERNGKVYLPPCLYSHAPVDLVVLALGGNDLKVIYQRLPEQITAGLVELIHIIKNSTYGRGMLTAPEILILSPPRVQPIAETFIDDNGGALFAGCVDKSIALIKLYAAAAASLGCHYLDLSADLSTSAIDGLHFDNHGHQTMSQLVFKKIKEIYAASAKTNLTS